MARSAVVSSPFSWAIHPVYSAKRDAVMSRPGRADPVVREASVVMVDACERRTGSIEAGGRL
ncbi:hypothetical protein ACFQ2B_16795 [Streptomyces stramineus]